MISKEFRNALDSIFPTEANGIKDHSLRVLTFVTNSIFNRHYRSHYLEYLCLLIRQSRLETLDILKADDLETVVRRENRKLPPKPYGILESFYRQRLVEVSETPSNFSFFPFPCNFGELPPSPQIALRRIPSCGGVPGQYRPAANFGLNGLCSRVAATWNRASRKGSMGHGSHLSGDVSKSNAEHN